MSRGSIAVACGTDRRWDSARTSSASSTVNRQSRLAQGCRRIHRGGLARDGASWRPLVRAAAAARVVAPRAPVAAAEEGALHAARHQVVVAGVLGVDQQSSRRRRQLGAPLSMGIVSMPSRTSARCRSCIPETSGARCPTACRTRDACVLCSTLMCCSASPLHVTTTWPYHAPRDVRAIATQNLLARETQNLRVKETQDILAASTIDVGWLRHGVSQREAGRCADRAV